MPRANILIPPQQKAIRNDLRGLYGGMMSVTDVQKEIGADAWDTANKFVDGLCAYSINGRRKWRTIDIADRIWGSKLEDD